MPISRHNVEGHLCFRRLAILGGFQANFEILLFFAVFPLLSRLGCQKIYHHWNEASESENENSSETSEQNETTCRYAHCEIQNFTKIRITLPLNLNSQWSPLNWAIFATNVFRNLDHGLVIGQTFRVLQLIQVVHDPGVSFRAPNLRHHLLMVS